MNNLMLNAATVTTDLSLPTGMPLYILLPLIIVIAIGSVVVIRWIYKKMNK